VRFEGSGPPRHRNRPWLEVEQLTTARHLEAVEYSYRVTSAESA